MSRKERRKIKEKRVINIFFIIAILVVFFYIAFEVYREKKQEKENNYQVKRLFIDEYENNSDEKENCYYENRKLALEWSNIEDLIMRYACYLSLSEEEAI